MIARLIEDLAAVTGERDRVAGEVAEVERLKAEAALRDRILAERADEIRWLRGEVSKLNDKLTPAALPEQAGTCHRWWKFWQT